MSFRPLLFAIAASLAGGLVCAQTAGGPETATNSVPQADKPPERPVITPELRGDLFMMRKQYREAIDAFREGPPKNAVLANKMGIAYHQMLQLDQALKSYQQAVKYKKDYVEAINNIGTVYYARKSFRRAITYYQKALKLAPQVPKSASIYSNLGTALFARKKYKDATLAFQNAINLDPEVFEHRSNYGIMLEERNVDERAKYHYYVAKLYASNGRNELALQYLRKALEEGFKERKQLEKDPEFAALRETKEFKDLLALDVRVL